MAKPLGTKSRVIRAAIAANPDKGNTELAEMLNDSQDRLDDKLMFTAPDVAAQKQAMKKPGAQKVEAAPQTTASETSTPAQPEPAATPASEAAAGNGRKRPGRKPGRKPGPRKATTP